MNGRITIEDDHPAFTPPEMSLRRKMSAKIAMNIQMNMNQKKEDDHGPEHVAETPLGRQHGSPFPRRYVLRRTVSVAST